VKRIAEVLFGKQRVGNKGIHGNWQCLPLRSYGGDSQVFLQSFDAWEPAHLMVAAVFGAVAEAMASKALRWTRFFVSFD